MKKTSHTIHTDTILESISDGVFTVDSTWRITSFNRAAELITGVSRDKALGRRCAEVFHGSLCEDGCPLRRTLASGSPLIEESAYIVDVTGRRIPISISTAILRDDSGAVVGGAETFRDLSQVEALRKQLSGRFRLGDLVSRSPAMRAVFEVIPVVAASEATVLVQGETGTGKELVAKAIHARSPRAKGPLVAVNCAAFPDTLLESELFGHRAGAFTGATRDRAGRFAVAEGGTLFLDEIGEMSPAMQVRMLRVLQERSYEPLGSSRPVRADVRIVAATNRDLGELVKDGTFREDLYYRVRVMQIDIIPLRSRKEDIPLLVSHFVDRFNRRQDKAIRGVEPRALALLMAHDWPGNVRELENAIEHAFVLCTTDRIEPTHLPVELLARRPIGNGDATLQDAVKHTESRLIEEALRRFPGDRSAAAEALGIHRSTLFRKMRELGFPTGK